MYNSGCAGCHGFAGDGPMAPPLDTAADLPGMGDVGQLASYIDANMPLGDPGQCNANCSNLIAQYILDQFIVPPPPACTDSATYYGARQIKVLTRKQYQRTVQDLLGVNFDVTDTISADLVVGYFPNNTHLAINSAAYDQYVFTAEEIAQWAYDQNFATSAITSIVNCNGTFNSTCATNFMNNMAPRIFRRALESPTEVTRYTNMANGSQTGGDVKAGLRLALQAMLSAPQFLYRHEIGEEAPAGSGNYEMTSYEMATWLSYTFAGSTPDSTGHGKGANNSLRGNTTTVSNNIIAEAQRLIGTGSGSTRAREVVGDFVGSWLDTDNLQLSPKDSATWPQWTQTLRDSLSRETRENFAEVMLNGNERFPALYNADWTFINSTLGTHYGLSGGGSNYTRVNTGERGGVLVNGAFMSRWAESKETSPIRRAVRVRRRMLCQNMPVPPAGVALSREELLEQWQDVLNDPSTTNRMKYEILTQGEPCQSCHGQWINPLGFGMEDYDAVGRKRSQDLNANLIDASGALYAPDRLSNKGEFDNFTGAEALGDMLASSPTAQSCMAENFFRYVTGVGIDGIDTSNPAGPKLDQTEKNGYRCETQSMTSTMTGTSPRAMLERLGNLEAVRYRKAWPRQ
jgi:hypothetical protein